MLRPGGRFAVSDVIADAGMDEATRADMQQWTGCIAGALTEDAFRAALAAAGLVDVEIRPTHRVHTHAGSAIVRARKPLIAWPRRCSSACTTPGGRRCPQRCSSAPPVVATTRSRPGAKPIPAGACTRRSSR